MRRLLCAFMLIVALSGCTPDEVAFWLTAPKPDRDHVARDIIRQVAAEYGVDAEVMIRIAECESGLEPTARNPSSGAAGLFQHLPQYWPGRAEAVGAPGASWADPYANARAAAWLMQQDGTAPWAASRACWR